MGFIKLLLTILIFTYFLQSLKSLKQFLLNLQQKETDDK